MSAAGVQRALPAADGADIVTFEGPRCTCALAPGATALGLADWLRSRAAAAHPFDDPALEIVTEDRGRTLLRGALLAGASTIEIDVHLGRPGFDGDVSRHRRARAEMDRLVAAADRGLPVVAPLAAGEVRTTAGPRGFSITASTRELVTPDPATLDAAAARELGRLLRQAHDAGLHAALAPHHTRLDRSGRALLVGLAGGRFAEPPDDDERADALALFCGHFDGLTEGGQGSALLAGYAASLTLADRSFRRARRARQRLLQSAGRGALREGAVVEHVTTDGGEQWWIRRGLDVGLRTEIESLRPSADGGAPQHAEVVRDGRRGGVWRSERVVVKERDAAHGRRLFVAAHWLAAAGVPGAEPLALRIRRGRSTVAFERLPGDDLAARCADPERAPDTREACALAVRLGRAVGRLHAFGLRNRDLKLDNLMVRPDGEVAMVDLDGVVKKRILDCRGEGRDLGRLRAAWARLDRPDEQRVVRAFWRGYHRARSCLAHKTAARLRRRIEERAREWEAAHPRRPA